MAIITIAGSSISIAGSSISINDNRTIAPSLSTLLCQTNGTDYFVRTTATNNDGSSVLLEVSQLSNFPANSSTQSATVAAGATASFSFPGYSNPPGTQTLYARATATGRPTSDAISRTDNMVLCQAI